MRYLFSVSRCRTGGSERIRPHANDFPHRLQATPILVFEAIVRAVTHLDSGTVHLLPQQVLQHQLSRKVRDLIVGRDQ